MTQYQNILQEALSCWQRLSAFRKERERNKNYAFGRQWNDYISVNGTRMTEHDYIISEGNIPLQNNLIRRILRNVLGVFRSQLQERMEKWDKQTLAYATRNRLPELFARTMEEFLISGLAVHRRWTASHLGQPAECVDHVSPESFFFDSSCRDPRGWDVQMIGQIHDATFGEWCDAFVSSEADYLSLVNRRATLGRSALRVVEVWRHERRPRRLIHDVAAGKLIVAEVEQWKADPRLRQMPSRWIIDDVWRFYFIDMEGHILRQGDSPLPSGHPYIFKAYPFLDGEIHSFVHDIIDQQRYANRLITLYDWVMRASAKGVLLIPEGSVDSDSLQDVADQWGRFNGVIVYKPKPGMPDPKQVSANTANIGIGELLNIQLKMLEDVSGVNGALQGNIAGNSVSGTLYSQQTQNSLTSLADLLESYFSFVDDTLSQMSSTALL
ncbi:MAG: hypothetical protein HDR88_14195 [Bacteroides sp.]|nr:hypothetical protein [Bacteroides sp.]